MEFTNPSKAEFLILESIRCQIHHLQKEINRLNLLKDDIKRELENNGFSKNIYMLLHEKI